MRRILIALLLIASSTRFVFADDFGPRGDVRDVRFAAQRLLADTARKSKTEPQNTTISDVVVVKDDAAVSWRIGPKRGFMGLVRLYDRWWDTLDFWPEVDGWIDSVSYPLPSKCSVHATGLTAENLIADGMPREFVEVVAAHSALIRAAEGRASVSRRGRPISHVVLMDGFCGRPFAAIGSPGGVLWDLRTYTAGYDLTLNYRRNNATSGDSFERLYARAPTQAEIIPYPTTMHFVSTAVLYFDLTIDGAAPVIFEPGTAVDIWFPFVLDDWLKYDLTIGYADKPIGPIFARPFDNVLHFVLPGFTATPGRTLMAEVDGDWP